MGSVETDLTSTLTTESTTASFTNELIKQISIAANIPPEIFIKICEYLPPSDLLTLTGVCKKFHSFLCSPESPITQDIWRVSRVQFLPGLHLPPPKGMYEEEYVKFGNLLTKCQYCYTRKAVKIYWQFLVRCCHECLIKNTTVIPYSKDHNWMSDNVLTGLVYVRHNNQILFWTPDVKSSFKEFEAISGSIYSDWVEKRRERRIRIMEDASQRDKASSTNLEEDAPTILLNPNTEITRTTSTSIIPTTTTIPTFVPTASINNTSTNSVINLNSISSALAGEVSYGEFSLSPIRLAGTRSTHTSTVPVLNNNFGRIHPMDIMITDSP